MTSPNPQTPSEVEESRINPVTGILVTLALIIIILALVEGVVRARQWWLYGSATHLEEVIEYRPDLGLRIPKPGYATSTIRINALGFRGPELEMPKPPGRLRLAFLGGSTTYCAEVSGNEKVWAHGVWERLQTRYPEIPMDYVNGGISGYTTASSMKNLEQRVAPLKPDLIVIYHASNDMTQETSQLAEARGLASGPKNNSWLANYSVFWFLVEKNLQVWKVQNTVGQASERINTFPDDFGSWFEERLVTLIREAQKTASLVAVVTWTQQMRREHSADRQLKAATSSLYFMPYMTPLSLLEGYERYNDAIRRAAQRTGALLIEEAERIPGDTVHFNDAVHFTDAGSRIMADRVSDALQTWRRFQDLLNQYRSKSSSQNQKGGA